VHESDIRFEAFGPASIGKPKPDASRENSKQTACHSIKFAQSETTLVWDDSHQSILELAEANDISIDSGCRAGNCGTCEIELISGAVAYPDGLKPDCQAGHCLACVARPTTATELDA